MMYYGESLSGFHLPFNFHLISTPWNAPAVAALVNDYERALPAGGWPNWVLGNHDKPRVATRLGGVQQARLAAVLLLTLRGTPTIYNGDEIGMQDGVIPPDKIQDPWEKNLPGLGLGRDPCRTPLVWTNAAKAGFTCAEPWLPITQDVATCNVASQREDLQSLLMLYRRLISLRRAEPALAVGDYRHIRVTDHTYEFERSWQDRRLLIALNFSGSTQPLTFEDDVHLVLSTNPNRRIPLCSGTELEPFEGIIAAGAQLT